ncbi:hypothetical protein BRADI_1g25142v3 [Brachypodium distachyon]|uniref:DUF4283 domain-containing protein n=1 Tax=Brachypodium distachyon TaxID=15368 RepID=A0A2K2DKZ6_BRADI|nr:hypothetical protein BRADI_1g25142v3 [Brachypodium distachyon]
MVSLRSLSPTPCPNPVATSPSPAVTPAPATTHRAPAYSVVPSTISPIFAMQRWLGGSESPLSSEEGSPISFATAARTLLSKGKVSVTPTASSSSFGSSAFRGLLPLPSGGFMADARRAPQVVAPPPAVQVTPASPVLTAFPALEPGWEPARRPRRRRRQAAPTCDAGVLPSRPVAAVTGSRQVDAPGRRHASPPALRSSPSTALAAIVPFVSVCFPRPPSAPVDAPPRAFRYVPRTAAIEAAESRLGNTLTAIVVGSRTPVSHLQVLELLEQHFELSSPDVEVAEFAPEDFLLQFESSAVRDHLLHAGPLRAPSFSLNLRRWTRQAHGRLVPCLFSVTLDVYGLPPHGTDVASVTILLAPGCCIERVSPETADRSCPSCYRVVAHTHAPYAIELELVMTIPKPVVASDTVSEAAVSNLPMIEYDLGRFHFGFKSIPHPSSASADPLDRSSVVDASVMDSLIPSLVGRLLDAGISPNPIYRQLSAQAKWVVSSGLPSLGLPTSGPACSLSPGASHDAGLAPACLEPGPAAWWASEPVDSPLPVAGPVLGVPSGLRTSLSPPPPAEPSLPDACTSVATSSPPTSVRPPAVEPAPPPPAQDCPAAPCEAALAPPMAIPASPRPVVVYQRRRRGVTAPPASRAAFLGAASTPISDLLPRPAVSARRRQAPALPRRSSRVTARGGGRPGDSVKSCVRVLMRKLGSGDPAPDAVPDLAAYEAAFDQPLSPAQVSALGQLFGLSPPADLDGSWELL